MGHSARSDRCWSCFADLEPRVGLGFSVMVLVGRLDGTASLGGKLLRCYSTCTSRCRARSPGRMAFRGLFRVAVLNLQGAKRTMAINAAARLLRRRRRCVELSSMRQIVFKRETWHTDLNTSMARDGRGQSRLETSPFSQTLRCHPALKRGESIDQPVAFQKVGRSLQQLSNI